MCWRQRNCPIPLLFQFSTTLVEDVIVTVFLFRGCEAAALKKGVGDHCHVGVRVRPMPGSSFEIIEPKLFPELLMGLPTDPARLDGAGEHPDRRLGRQTRGVVFVLPLVRRSPINLASLPGMWVTHLANALRRPVSDPHTHSGEASRHALSCHASASDAVGAGLSVSGSMASRISTRGW